jgi:RNA polymerase subunit RPABC4/transcription elongation factor Spt4
LLGVWLLRRPAWWSALPAGFASVIVAWKAYHVMPAAVMSGILLLEQRMQPLNDLLARFTLPPMSLFDLGQPWSRIRGPGEMTVLFGGLVALAGALASLASYRDARAMERCGACGHRDRPGRVTAFCVRCGAAMPAERACPECHTLAEPGDACCAVCGSRLLAVLP